MTLPPATRGVGAGGFPSSNVSISAYHICPGRVVGTANSSGSPPRAHHKQEVVVNEDGAVVGAVWVIAPIEVNAEATGVGVTPIARCHGRARGRVPAQFGGLSTSQEPAPAEHGVPGVWPRPFW